MNTSVKDRFSNVIAWLGFLINTTAFCCYALVAVLLAWHLVSPIADYDPELEEGWNWVNSKGIHSRDELMVETASLEDSIATNERELFKLESDHAEVEPTRNQDSLWPYEGEALYLHMRIVADTDQLKRLRAYTSDGAKDIFAYGESRKRFYFNRFMGDIAVMVSYPMPLGVLIVILNYVMLGSFRLLPWRRFEE